jgi:hypothetical protein
VELWGERGTSRTYGSVERRSGFAAPSRRMRWHTIRSSKAKPQSPTSCMHSCASAYVPWYVRRRHPRISLRSRREGPGHVAKRQRANSRRKSGADITVSLVRAAAAPSGAPLLVVSVTPLRGAGALAGRPSQGPLRSVTPHLAGHALHGHAQHRQRGSDAAAAALRVVRVQVVQVLSRVNTRLSQVTPYLSCPASTAWARRRRRRPPRRPRAGCAGAE